MQSNRSYFMRRAAQERSAASHAKGKARQAHQVLAEYYEDRVHGTDGAESQTGAAA